LQSSVVRTGPFCGAAHGSVCGHSFGVRCIRREAVHRSELVRPLVRGSAWALVQPAWGAGSACGLVSVGCMWRVGAYACVVTREKDRQREKERGPAYSMSLSSVCFHVFRCMCSYVLSKCCMYFIWMLYVFYLDVAYAAMTIHVFELYLF
jgi:hypothetical protein